MKILILGGDGYLGWPTAMHFANKGHKVNIVDNYSRRKISKKNDSKPLFNNPNLIQRTKIFKKLFKKSIKVDLFDCQNFTKLNKLIKNFKPELIIHYAEQPSAPYSMMGFDEAKFTLNNNLNVTFNIIWSVINNCPNSHIIKLGTMGEYGTPNIDIEEGWINLFHKGRKDKFLFPRQGSSLYHTTKILDTDLLWFYVRLYKVRVTDLMQGPVYGILTNESFKDDRLLPNFHYDDIFGTVVNRFLVQAVSGHPLTVYGKGEQKRGYLNLKDTINCIELASKNPPQPGKMSILNQFTETFTVNEIASKVKKAGNKIGLNVKIKSINNPRKEKEKHYYNPKYTGLKKLGLKPNYMSEEVIITMLNFVHKYKKKIDSNIIKPRVNWK